MCRLPNFLFARKVIVGPLSRRCAASLGVVIPPGGCWDDCCRWWTVTAVYEELTAQPGPPQPTPLTVTLAGGAARQPLLVPTQSFLAESTHIFPFAFAAPHRRINDEGECRCVSRLGLDFLPY